MAQANDRLEIIRQNLIDAGCDEAAVKACMTLAEEEKVEEILPYLAKHRASLVETVRAGQKQIDRLDYLVYQIRRAAV